MRRTRSAPRDRSRASGSSSSAGVRVVARKPTACSSRRRATNVRAAALDASIHPASSMARSTGARSANPISTLRTASPTAFASGSPTPLTSARDRAWSRASRCTSDSVARRRRPRRRGDRRGRGRRAWPRLRHPHSAARCSRVRWQPPPPARNTVDLPTPASPLTTRAWLDPPTSARNSSIVSRSSARPTISALTARHRSDVPRSVSADSTPRFRAGFGRRCRELGLRSVPGMHSARRVDVTQGEHDGQVPVAQALPRRAGARQRCPDGPVEARRGRGAHRGS